MLTLSPKVQGIQAMFHGNEDAEWSFSEKKSIDVLTHGYHRYPAKFLPQLVAKLIKAYTRPGDKIADVFAGCGTTLVESKVHGRRSTGVDINPVAQFITRVKTNSVCPKRLDKAFKQLTGWFSSYRSDTIYYNLEQHPRIDYWFVEENKNKVAFLHRLIHDQPTSKKNKEFFLCALSHVLKNCSRWLQDGTKPQIDPQKIVHDVFACFELQAKKMIRKNREFHDKLKKEGKIKVPCTIRLADARGTGIRSNSINAIITSPPYVTSYEYADIHQLTAYWFEYMNDLAKFRQKFIGTFYSQNENLIVTGSAIAQDIVDQLEIKDLRMAKEVANYFRDMMSVAREMNRILVNGGTTCVVIGNTELLKVQIHSAEAFAEMLDYAGFDMDKVIKRAIPNKLNPTIRDTKTGQFAKLESKTSKKVYPNEYIIIARKSDVSN